MKKIAIIQFLILFVFSSLFSQNNIDWSKPDAINPLDEKIDNFLDIKLDTYIYEAELAESKADYLKAAKYYLFILRYDYNNAEYIYKLSRCYGFLKEYEFASENLIRAVKAGYNDYKQISEDIAFAGIKRTAVFKKALTEIQNYSKKFGKIAYIETTKLNKCRYKLPENFIKENKYDLVIGMHGNGGSADNFISYSDFVTGDDVIFAAPQGAYLKVQSNNKLSAQYSWEIQVAEPELWKKGDPFTEQQILNTVKYFKEKYNINNVYLLGFSQGAAYTYVTGLKNPDVFKGIICIGGRLPSTDKSYSVISEEQIIAGNQLNVFIAHGTEDTVLPATYAKDAKKRLKKAGYNITFKSYNAGHRITKELLTEIKTWIKNLE